MALFEEHLVPVREDSQEVAPQSERENVEPLMNELFDSVCLFCSTVSHFTLPDLGGIPAIWFAVKTKSIAGTLSAVPSLQIT